MSEAVRGRLAWVAWLLLVGVWTYCLLSPTVPREAGNLVTPGLRFYAAKALHLGVYSVLTLLAAWLPDRSRWGAWLGLLAHAAVTEWLQTFVPGRGGSASDVLINCCGIALGLAAALGLGLPGKDRSFRRAAVEPQPQK